MRAARPLAPCLHYPLAPAAAGVFSWLELGQHGASMVFVFLRRPRTKDQRKHG